MILESSHIFSSFLTAHSVRLKPAMAEYFEKGAGESLKECAIADARSRALLVDPPALTMSSISLLFVVEHVLQVSGLQHQPL